MMKTGISIALLVLISLTPVIGCGGGKKESVNSETVSSDSTKAVSEKSTSNSIEQVTATSAETRTENNPAVTQPNQAEFDLTGVWYGESAYDVDAFNARIATLSAPDALKLQDQISTFSTIVMAAEFRPDSVVELDMMITTNDGQQLRDRSVGTWKVLEKSGNQLTLETSEYKTADQQPTKKVYVYQVVDKDHFQFVPESVSADLKAFAPRIQFQRVEQPLAEAEVAEAQNGEVVR